MFIKRKRKRKPVSVAKSWKRIERWFETHAPEVMDVLNPGASEEQLSEFEEKTGLQLPEDVKEHYRIHNGHQEATPGAIIGEPFDSLDRVAGSVAFHQQLSAEYEESDADCKADQDCTSYPVDAIQCRHFNGRWIAIGDWDGNSYGIDLDPGPNGRLGQVINFGRDEDDKYVLALSWAHFLEDIADELEAGSISICRDKTGYVQSFGRKGKDDQAMYRFWKEWSEAKLPAAIQKMQPAQLEPVYPGKAIKNPLAQTAQERVEQFIREMHEFELKWLEIRPIHELGYGLVEEGPGAGGMVNGLNSEPFKTNEEREIQESRYKQLKLGSYKRRAIRQFRKIIATHCTDRKRANNNRFIQRYPTNYNAERDRVAEIRKVSSRELLVYLHPVNGETTRYHLKLSEGNWLIDFKDVTRDHSRFRKIALLFG